MISSTAPKIKTHNISLHFSVEEHILVSQLLRSFPCRIITTHLPVCEHTERFLLPAECRIWGEGSPWNSLTNGMVWSGRAVRLELEVHPALCLFLGRGRERLQSELGGGGRVITCVSPSFSSWPCTKAGVATRDVSMRRHSLTAGWQFWHQLDSAVSRGHFHLPDIEIALWKMSPVWAIISLSNFTLRHRPLAFLRHRASLLSPDQNLCPRRLV